LKNYLFKVPLIKKPKVSTAFFNIKKKKKK